MAINVPTPTGNSESGVPGSASVSEPSSAQLSVDRVKHVAALLRKAAPLVQRLFDDDSPDGEDARAALRQAVGQKTYSELAVQLSAMRSWRSYERARSGEIS